MSTINYFNIYSINFSKTNDFIDATNSFTDELHTEFQKALKAVTIQEGIKKGKAIVDTITKSLANCSTADQEKPGYKMFQETICDINESSRLAQTVLDQFEGANPYEIQKLVHFILGISIEPAQVSITDEVRKDYFFAMKKSGFLSTPYPSINFKDEKPIPHQPEVLAAQYLSTHPEVNTLTIGCGEARKTYLGSCHFRRRADHAHESFTIDLSMKMGPLVPVNMHDLEFWKAIPNGRFEKIFDHSNGYFLLDDPNSIETLKHLYRSLQPGGCLEMDIPFREKHAAILRTAGFFIEPGEQSIAKKVV